MNYAILNFRTLITATILFCGSNSYSKIVNKTTFNDYFAKTKNIPEIDFDGIDDYIEFGNVLDLTSTFSIEAWVLQETTVANGTVMSKGDSKAGSSDQRGYRLSIINNFPNITWYDASGNTIVNLTSPYSIKNNIWYHISSTFDGASVKLYIDGLHVNEVAISNTPLGGTEPFLIGASYDSDTPNTPKNYFNGYIDEVRLWNIALTEKQIHDMMNQEIEQNGAIIKGKVTQLDISSGLAWSNLIGYYPMNDNLATDKSGHNLNGVGKNINSMQTQSAPLPYVTIDVNSDTAIDWDISTTWENGAVCSIPNAMGIDGSTPIDWNIVETKDNVFVNRNLKLLSLKNSNETLSINADYSLEITRYLKIDNIIDLKGDSQLIQGLDSYLDPKSSGVLVKNQQGTADTYTYNYWSSPVGSPNNTTNNNSYKLPDIFKDVSFLTSGYNGTASPLGIADYWIWKFNNRLNNNFSSWQHVRSTGTLKPGEGFTMKGPGTGSFYQYQNYVLKGKPNNGDINIAVNAGNDYLVGNPYPSAIDSNQFILDNSNVLGVKAGSKSTTGTLYFWEHWSGGSHIISEYQGGYATYSLAGGVPPASKGTNNLNLLTGKTTDKTPGRYIPVAQGFFVVAEIDGNIKFNNGQRVFQTEDGTNSLFIKSANTKNAAVPNNDVRLKLRLGYNSENQIHRQLLVTVDPLTTSGYDWGYDALSIDKQMDDMYWLIDTDKYVIQATNQINDQTILPIGIHNKNDGLSSITIDKLENTPDNLNIFVHDKELNIHHNLKQSNYDVFLLAGDYLNRFEITFATAKTLTINDVSNEGPIETFYSNEKQSIIIQNPVSKLIRSVELYNVLGQSIFKFKPNSTENYLQYGAAQIKSGIYILNIKTEFGIQSKKVLIK
tara:strand:+ start:33626 stop:36289 length:2664 start_codon:yes stop_codon:yes gene_type:complete